MTDPPDDLTNVLVPQPGEPSPALRDALLRATERRLTHDRFVRRATCVAVVGAVFVAGGLAGWFARPERQHVIEVAGAVERIAVPVPVLVDQGVHTSEPPPAPPSASEAELRAEQTDDRAEAAKLYRLAGDAFLRDEDYRNATRCYRLFLVRGGDGALSLEAGDSWLLTSLKNAAYKEKIHVSKTDG